MSKTKALYNLLLFIILCAILNEAAVIRLGILGSYSRLNSNYRESELFRNQHVDSGMKKLITSKDTAEDPGEYLGLYWLESNYGEMPLSYSYTRKNLEVAIPFWRKHKLWDDYKKTCEGLWNHLDYFPVAVPNSEKKSWSYVDTWGAKRNYGGSRRHEGCDIIPKKQKSGIYPIISVSDGVVTKKGWLPQGGYRVGITTEDDIFFYYAHLASYGDIEVGDRIKSGTVLGFMGDTGYSKIEGTTGNFPVHLHFGVYMQYESKEIAVNPYHMLCYLEKKKIKIQEE